MPFCKLSDPQVVFPPLDLRRAHKKVEHSTVGVRMSGPEPWDAVGNRRLTFPKGQGRAWGGRGGSLLMSNV